MGIHFDSRLLFYKHIEHVAEKSRALTYMLNRTTKLHWCLGHKSLKTIYEGAIVPLMTYGAPFWEGAITNNKYLQKLHSAQRLNNIKIAKAYRTISFEASCVIAGVQPIGLVIDRKVQVYKRKYGLGSTDIVCDMLLPVHEWPHPFLQATITETNEAITYPIEIYTDGGKDASTVGARVVIYLNKQMIMQYRYKLCSYCSNNQAEQIAILKALEQLQEMEAPIGGREAIYTDSRVTIDTLKNHDIHGFLIEKIRNIIRHLAIQNWTIHFRWVKAHIGIEGTEAADKLDKEAAEENKYKYSIR